MQNTLAVYLDWNILNKLWHTDEQPLEKRSAFSHIEYLIDQGHIIVPFSNAHIRDLSRGVVKQPEYRHKHISTIIRATKNLCITQYWGDTSAKWHIRNPDEFLEATLNDSHFMAESFSSLFGVMDLGYAGTLDILHNKRCLLLEMQRLPLSFKQLYKEDPIFSRIFPKAKDKGNMLALCEDIFSFVRVIMSDHALYKQFRKYLNSAKARSVEFRKISKKLHQLEREPEALSWDNMWEKAFEIANFDRWHHFPKIIELYTSTDLKGYHPDERFSNLIDDSLHTYYGAYCKYFITNDTRCLLKAKKVYQELDVQTAAYSIQEFAGIIKEGTFN